MSFIVLDHMLDGLAHEALFKLFKNIYKLIRGVIMAHSKTKISTPADNIKFWLMIIGIFVFIIIVAGLFSYFPLLKDAKQACVGDNSISNCIFKYQLVGINFKNGIYMGCNCDGRENYIKAVEDG